MLSFSDNDQADVIEAQENAFIDLCLIPFL